MAASPPAPPDYVHTLTVRYSECDAQGVVFNAHYQSLCGTCVRLSQIPPPWFPRSKTDTFFYLS
jgi:hypothetical protein